MIKLFVTLAAVVLFSTATLSQEMCGNRADIAGRLLTKFKEEPIGVGIANNGGLVELVTSADGETWTLMISYPNGRSCLIVAGEDWHEISPLINAPEA